MLEESYSHRSEAHAALAAIRACPFDLVARAELALEGCTRLTNPEREGQPYSYAELHTDPPVALHAPWDYADVTGRLLEALTYMRIMTGTAPDERDQAYATLLASCQGEDGLMFLPPSPWTHTAKTVEMEWSQRGALLAWTARYLALDDQDALRRAQKLVAALHKIAIWEADTCWYPASIYPEKGWTDRFPPVGRMTDVLFGAHLVFPLARFGAATGNQQALQLARGLIRFLRERSGAFTEEGKLSPSAAQYLHSSTSFVLGVVKYALATGQDALLDWAQVAYLDIRERGAEFGFFPHRLSGKDSSQGDLCATRDMLDIALMLGLHKDSAFLTDVERYGRNHLLECQILDLNWVENGTTASFCEEVWCSKYPVEGITVDRIAERAIGGFSGWSRFNDAFDPGNPRLMLRCNASGAMALYDMWHYGISRPEGAVQVHLHFSRDTRYASVTSEAPIKGAVEVMMKSRGVLAVRVPPHLQPDQIEVLVNGERARRQAVRGGYVWLEALQLGDMISVHWPQEERAMLYDQQGERLVGTWRGDTLFRMEPPGLLSPIYRRSLHTSPAPAHAADGPVKEIDSL